MSAIVESVQMRPVIVITFTGNFDRRDDLGELRNIEREMRDFDRHQTIYCVVNFSFVNYNMSEMTIIFRELSKHEANLKFVPCVVTGTDAQTRAVDKALRDARIDAEVFEGLESAYAYIDDNN